MGHAENRDVYSLDTIEVTDWMRRWARDAGVDATDDGAVRRWHAVASRKRAVA